MAPADAPAHPPRGLMSVDAGAFAGFDVHIELRRFLWSAVAVLASVLYLRAVAGR